MSRHNVAPISVEQIASELRARVSMALGDNQPGANVSSIVVTGVTQDSRECGEGDLYCCVVGATVDGHLFAPEAVARGAVAVLVERELDTIADTVAQIVVPDVRAALGPLARTLWGDVASKMRLVGVTGTNGKTSTCAILASILAASGERCEVIGTLSGFHTTPEAIDLHAQLADCHGRGVTTVVMEVSSHALAHRRVDGLRFERAVFTNLGRDHLDFHGTEENYFAAKARLFSSELADVGIVNGDDARGRQLLERSEITMVEYSLRDVDNVSIAGDRVEFTWRGAPIVVHVGGRFTVMNALAAITTASSMGVSPDAIRRGCASIVGIDGRFQHVANQFGVDVIIDFAHTPEGLRALLGSAREVTRGRLLVVFGCGGDRDAGKRAPMGQIAHALADEVYVTSDNPRSEDPLSIMEQIRAGMTGDGALVHLVADRREAIESAISSAKHGDMVVIAGKGHEKTQEIAGVFQPFHDAEVAEAAFVTRAQKERESGA